MIGERQLVGEPRIRILKVDFVHFGWNRDIDVSFLPHPQAAF